MTSRTEDIFRNFTHGGTFFTSAPHGGGHINDTYLIRTAEENEPDYILQRINKSVFTEPERVMENIVLVTRHMADRLTADGEGGRPVLMPIPARRRDTFSYRDEEGEYWRLYQHIAPSRSYDVAPGPDAAREGGRAFGRFQRLLADLPGERLHETIPRFHHMPSRLDALKEAAKEDRTRRRASIGKELDFALSREEEMTGISLMGEQGLLPLRVTHNDTKFNNVLLDDHDRALCVVDLDTVMPGLIHFDFGDMVRTAVGGTEEDERDLSLITFDEEIFHALAGGFLEETGAVLTPMEKDSLYLSGKTMAFIMGIRFLTDYLNGDVYYKISREGHNLDRCRNQFRLTEVLEEREDTLKKDLSSLFEKI